MTASPWMTVPEAAEYAKAGERTIRRAIANGTLAAGHVGEGPRGDARVHVDDLEAWLRQPRARRTRLSTSEQLDQRVRPGRRKAA